MVDWGRQLSLISLPLAFLAPAAAVAAPKGVAVPPPGQVQLMRPLTLAKLSDMDFGDLSVTTAGTAVIDAVTDTLGTTGGVVKAGGTPHAAKFRGAGGKSVVNIKVPNKAVTLTRIGGGASMILDNFTLDGQSKRDLAAAGVFDFKVGATLHPAANQMEGVYTGTFDVTIQYP